MQMLRMLMLVAATAAQDAHAGHDHGHEAQECSCAQHEADHPFTIDCSNAAAIRAATLTLESDACQKPRSDTFEWGGAFATPADSYTWVSEAATKEPTVASGYRYADATMMIVAFAVDKADVTHLFEKATKANTLMAGTCPEINMDAGKQTITPTADGVCRTIKFPDSSASLVDFHATINTKGLGHVAFFTAHMPTEFERDTHYFMSTDLKTDIEPVSQNKEYCKIDADANGLKKCQQAFLIIQSHHDYCPHDTLTRYEEELFHEWESKCNGCKIKRKYDSKLKYCPTVDCKDTTVAELGYSHLKANCVAANTKYAFEWAAVFDTPADGYKWVSQAATVNETFATNYTYADATMPIVAFAMPGNQKSALFGQKDAADKLMMAGCPEVSMAGGTPTITPTVAGVCVTIKFPDSTATLADFHANIVTTGIAHVAFFTGHVPTEFERDTHYFMSTDLKTDIEPVNALGAAAAHDHGRRLSIATSGSRATSTTSDIGRRRLADPGSCCTSVGAGGASAASQQGAWKQVVAYHDLCDHNDVPKEIEIGFHDYEASCEEYFCNLVGPTVDQETCPYSPPGAPPPPAPPPVVAKTMEVISGAATAGIIIAAISAGGLLILVLIFISREKQGKPIFTNLEAETKTKSAAPAVSQSAA